MGGWVARFDHLLHKHGHRHHRYHHQQQRFMWTTRLQPWPFIPPPPTLRRYHPRHHIPLSAFPRPVVSVAASSSSSTAATAATVTSDSHLQYLCKQRNLEEAVRFLLSLEDGRQLSQQTYESLILACTRRKALRLGRVVQRHLIDHGLAQDTFLATKLINMYSACDSINEARLVFNAVEKPSIFLYNALIRAFALIGHFDESLALFRQLIDDAAVDIDRFTYPYVLKACCASELLGLGKQIHGHILRKGFESDVYISTTLVDMYAKCRRIKYARRVFVEMPEKNVVSWSAMIASHVKNGRIEDALEIFREMMDVGISPNSVTLVSILQGFGTLSALGQGKTAHAFVLRRGLESILSVRNSLVAMYAKCGALVDARKVFERMPKRDTVSWNSMIAGYGVNGLAAKAIGVFEEMIQARIPPSEVTFLSLLGACSHVGLVEESLRFFESMEKQYDISPWVEHYACMVDILGRAGLLEEAAKLIEKMPSEPSATVWGALLGACRIHGNVELAERATQFLFELEPLNAGNYVLLADIYAKAGRWEDVARVKRMVEERGLQKVSGCSWIEVRKWIYSFVSLDQPNPQIEQVHALLLKISREMKQRGYVPNTDIVLYELQQHEKEQVLLGHSEKLALGFGLINTSSPEIIRITKNLRLCEDCHSMTKFVSEFTGREILVRDVNRFHHFKDGSCSCSDYW
ncbi:pentatricopeptide repeat-containing protein At3g46790, chloroplastic [Nymphaea colorata]|uniref:DYW domain-containing protein n=1 Tax=Nymphaea colorata TaxID=210225 RepID=A0A5K0ZI18_9MAGN|nr:pentatricopeptide repeat-containing protein At3g46790, chloroplastic [Nymphaea colorata]